MALGEVTEMFERFSDRGRRVMVQAYEQARLLEHDRAGTGHLLLALVHERDDPAAQLLQALGITQERLRRQVEQIIARQPRPPRRHEVTFTRRAKHVLGLAVQEAVQWGHTDIGPEHILLALTREGEGTAVAALIGVGADLIQVRQQVMRVLADQDPDEPYYGSLPYAEDGPAMAGVGARDRGRATTTSVVLDRFGHNLTQAARDGSLDPVIGRESEIERLTQVLSRRTKNNPMLIGEPGVGKTAVVEGLAQAIANDRVPATLAGKQLYTLDLAALVAGSRYRGDFEERLTKVLKEIRVRGDIVLFVDEIHTLVGTGSSTGVGGGEGSAIDAAAMLKPVMARGEVQVIGATTPQEHHKHLDRDAALERRFQPIRVGEPSLADTIEILKGLRDRYEAHHRVSITDAALTAAATLADRYITDRYLPDKAIDLIDEAGARVRIRGTDHPPQRREIDERIARVCRDKQAAIDAQDFERAAQLRDQQQQLIAESPRGLPAQSPVVDGEQIAQVLAAWTGIPVGALSERETARLLRMEHTLHQRVIGQHDAVQAVSRAIRRTRAGLKDPKRPAGSFIFAGLSGVGKTELSKALAEFLFGSESALIQLDMSEYNDHADASRLIGAPPGYLGHDEGGQLTETVRRRPFSVVLFDEIEKADPEVLGTLLQILEEGRLTDGQGRTVDFKNTVIILTSNLGTRDITKAVPPGFQPSPDNEDTYQRMRRKVNDELNQHLRPELLNRIDDTIVFHQLTEQQIRRIVDLMIDRIEAQLRTRNMALQVTDNAKTYLATTGFDPVLGARPLRRTIQREIEDAISDRILHNQLTPGRIIVIDCDPSGDAENPTLTFRTTPQAVQTQRT
jgi:ATP-dependent Clp protease ATP-binding subunit ClpC